MTPTWIVNALLNVGTREIKGALHNSLILSWWKKIKRGGIKDDETPWCAAFVGAMLEGSGIVSSRFESAKSYLTWGVKLTDPVYGCIVVFNRDGGGHVGFVVGVDAFDNLLVLGGNQSDVVCIRAFGRDRVAGYRFPAGVQIPEEKLIVSRAEMTRSEA